jgi:hypothetical protein
VAVGVREVRRSGRQVESREDDHAVGGVREAVDGLGPDREAPRPPPDEALGDHEGDVDRQNHHADPADGPFAHRGCVRTPERRQYRYHKSRFNNSQRRHCPDCSSSARNSRGHNSWTYRGRHRRNHRWRGCRHWSYNSRS